MNLGRSIRDFSKALQGVIRKAVNDRCGIINGLVEEPPSPDSSGLWLVHAILSPATYYRNNAPGVHTTDRGTGAAFTRQKACWAAIGEAIERYAASIYWPDQLLTASAAALGDKALDLVALVRGGHPNIRAFDPNLSRAWATGGDLVSGQVRLVPAAMAYLGYQPARGGEIICQNDSTGLACGNSIDGALLSAICEVVERDVFASNWLLRRRAPRLVPGAALARLDVAVQKALCDDRTRIRLFHLGFSFGVHVVMSVVTCPGGIGVVAAGASPSIVRAIEKAVCEGLYSWASGQKFIGKVRVRSAAAIKSTSDHLLYYLEPSRFAIVEDMCVSSEAVSVETLLQTETASATAQDIGRLMQSEGFTPAFVDLTTTDVGLLNMAVVRVVVPGLQPLIFGGACTRVPDSRRLDQWRQTWGIPGAVLNPHPHPFP